MNFKAVKDDVFIFICLTVRADQWRLNGCFDQIRDYLNPESDSNKQQPEQDQLKKKNHDSQQNNDQEQYQRQLTKRSYFIGKHRNITEYSIIQTNRTINQNRQQKASTKR